MKRRPNTVRTAGDHLEVYIGTPRYPDKVLLIDYDDWVFLSALGGGRIYVWAKPNRKKFYASMRLSRHGQRIAVLIHRFLLPDSKIVDHINGNGLDNRRCNIRAVTPRQNCQNKSTPKSSSHPGVSWSNHKNRWDARLQINGKITVLGRFRLEEDAIRAYRDAVHAIGEKMIDEI